QEGGRQESVHPGLQGSDHGLQRVHRERDSLQPPAARLPGACRRAVRESSQRVQGPLCLPEQADQVVRTRRGVILLKKMQRQSHGPAAVFCIKKGAVGPLFYCARFSFSKSRISVKRTSSLLGA